MFTYKIIDMFVYFHTLDMSRENIGGHYSGTFSVAAGLIPNDLVLW